MKGQKIFVLFFVIFSILVTGCQNKKTTTNTDDENNIVEDAPVVDTDAEDLEPYVYSIVSANLTRYLITLNASLQVIAVQLLEDSHVGQKQPVIAADGTLYNITGVNVVYDYSPVKNQSIGYFTPSDLEDMPWYVSEDYVYQVSNGQAAAVLFRTAVHTEIGDQDNTAWRVDDYYIDNIYVYQGEIYLFLYRWVQKTIEYHMVIMQESTLEYVETINLSTYGNSIRGIFDYEGIIYLLTTQDPYSNPLNALIAYHPDTKTVSSTELTMSGLTQLSQSNALVALNNAAEYETAVSNVCVFNLETQQSMVTPLDFTINSMLLIDKQLLLTDTSGQLYQYTVDEKGNLSVSRKILHSPTSYQYKYIVGFVKESSDE